MKTHKIVSPLQDQAECGAYGVVYNYDATDNWDHVTCPKCIKGR